MKTHEDVKAGDLVIVHENYKRGGPVLGRVTKAGPKLVSVITKDSCHDRIFRRDTGYLNDKNFSTSAYYRTPEEEQSAKKRAVSQAVLKTWGLITQGGGRQLTDNQINRVAELLDTFDQEPGL
jgi:hypothetical protein